MPVFAWALFPSTAVAPYSIQSCLAWNTQCFWDCWAIPFSEYLFLHSQLHHCPPSGWPQQAALPLGAHMQPGPSPAISVTVLPCLSPSANTGTSLSFQDTEQGLRHALDTRAFEALCRNRRGCQWKERSVTSFSFSHPVGTETEHALALECLELICAIVGHSDFMVLYVHCSWGALKQHTCSSIICTFKDSHKSTGVPAPYCSS